MHPPMTLRARASGRPGLPKRFVALQGNVQLALECRHFGDLHPNDRAWRKLDRPRKIAEWSFAIGRSKAGDVQNRFALKFPTAALIKKLVLEGDLLDRRADRLKCFAQNACVKIGAAGEQNPFGELWIKSQAVA